MSRRSDVKMLLDGMVRVDFREAEPDPIDRLVWGITGEEPAEGAPGASAPASANVRVSIARLPATGEHFVAREAELARLDAAWDDPDTQVISFVALGGVGKSALVNAWLDRLKANGRRGAERVLGWSFYSQGTEEVGASSEAFTEYTLEWLGYEGEIIKSPWKKGEVIADLIRERRTLLVLDGLEPPPARRRCRRGGRRR